MNVENIYKRNVTFIHQAATIKEAMQKMVENHINGLPVVDNNDSLVGILSIQDIAVTIIPPEIQLHPSSARKKFSQEFFERICKEAGQQRVSTVMRTDYTSIDINTSVIEIAADFIKHDLYMVAVLEKGMIVGIVTRTELKNAIAGVMGHFQKKSKQRAENS